MVALMLAASPVWAQLQLLPLPKVQSTNASARVSTTRPQTLPFWDDFSFTTGTEPLDTLWEFGRSVWINNGMGINPPSLGVATFDGLDSLGGPYSVTEVLAKGFADALTSQPIRLDLVPLAQRGTVFLSFYYQIRGRGEAPDPGDQLRLQLLNSNGTWETIWSVENDGSLQPDIFYPAILAIPTEERFFFDRFRFRFQNFARLSGPFDTWHIDYVYLNSNRTALDTSFPDRTLVSPLTSIFGEYYSVPIKHFLADPASMLTPAGFTMYNLREGNIQPLNFYTRSRIINYVDGISTEQTLDLDIDTSLGAIDPLTFKGGEIQVLPPLSAFQNDADTITLDFRLGLSTKDNQLITEDGDYDPAKYSPVQFRWNDTTRTSYFLSNYYAYDDGTAEYGAGLNQPGSSVAYRFDMKTAEPDTIVEVAIYFPRFGDDSQQLIQLQILKDLEGNAASLLHEQTITVQRSQQNQFGDTYKLNRFVGVQGSFYIGWKQNAASVIAVGLDKNTDSGDKIFVNTNGVWEQNQNVNGSLMIRPIFGKGGLVVGINDDGKEYYSGSRVFPNPGNGIFNISAQAKDIRAFTMSGAELPLHEVSSNNDTKQMQITDVQSGYYLVIYTLLGFKYIQRLVIFR